MSASPCVARIENEFDVSSDGERFIMIKQPEDELPRRLVVMTHFFEELKRLVPI